MTTAYPLHWPGGWPRTEPYHRRQSPFRTGAEKTRRHLMNELKLLGATNVIISSNVEIRRDGMPYADAARRGQKDPGVAVYFTLKGKPMTMARDRYLRVEDNLRSIGLAVEAMRSIERHGGAVMMERAFEGFSALPPPREDIWRALGIPPGSSPTDIERAFRIKAMEAHPDKGGSSERMAALNAARADALRQTA